MKQKTMQELNEQYKDCPQRENEYTVCGQKMIVVKTLMMSFTDLRSTGRSTRY